MDTDGDGTGNNEDLDDDNDGNPDVTDPSPTAATAANDDANTRPEEPVTLSLLGNDDYVSGAVITNTGNGDAQGDVSFNQTIGEMTYTPAIGERGTVTVEYRVCNNAVNPPVCSTAVASIHINVATSVPTLSTWMLLLLMSLLVLVGLKKETKQTKDIQNF